jgi:hypothetical protein
MDLNEKRPQLLEGKTGAVIPMRQVGGRRMTGASLNVTSDLPLGLSYARRPFTRAGLFVRQPGNVWSTPSGLI